MKSTHYQFVNIVYRVKDENTYKLDVYAGSTVSGSPLAEVLLPRTEELPYYSKIDQKTVREYLIEHYNITFDFEYPSYTFSEEVISKWNNSHKSS